MSEGEVNLYFGDPKDSTHIQIWKSDPESTDVNLMIDGKWIVVLDNAGLKLLAQATQIADQKNNPK